MDSDDFSKRFAALEENVTKLAKAGNWSEMPPIHIEIHDLREKSNQQRKDHDALTKRLDDLCGCVAVLEKALMKAKFSLVAGLIVLGAAGSIAWWAFGPTMNALRDQVVVAGATHQMAVPNHTHE